MDAASSVAGVSVAVIAHELHADEEPGAAHVADEIVFSLKRPQLAEEMPADVERVRLQPVVDRRAKRREARGASRRAAAERAEELHPVVEALRDLSRRDDRAHRVSVRDRLAEHDDVRDDVVGIEGPEVRAEPAEACLHLVGDAHAAGRAHQGVHGREIARRQHDLAADARARLGEVPAEAAAARANLHRSPRRPGGRIWLRRPGRLP